MGSSEPLAIESFSRSWLTSASSPLDGLEEPLRPSLDSFYETTSEELDYRMQKSKGSLEEIQNFNFDVPISQFPDPLAHADQLFSNGLIKPVYDQLCSDGLIRPVYLNKAKIEASDYFDVIPSNCSPVSSKTVVPNVHIQCHLFKKWRKSSERILHKCFECLRPFCHKINGSRKSIRVDDIDRRARQVKSWNNSPQSSPVIAYSTNDLCDIEHSIYEAVLHCKRSIDK